MNALELHGSVEDPLSQRILYLDYIFYVGKKVGVVIEQWKCAVHKSKIPRCPLICPLQCYGATTPLSCTTFIINWPLTIQWSSLSCSYSTKRPACIHMAVVLITWLVSVMVAVRTARNAAFTSSSWPSEDTSCSLGDWRLQVSSFPASLRSFLCTWSLVPNLTGIITHLTWCHRSQVSP